VIRREDQKSEVQRSDRTGASRGGKMHDRGENRAITFPDMFRSKVPSGMRLLIPHSTRVEHYRTKIPFPGDPPGIASVALGERARRGGVTLS